MEDLISMITAILIGFVFISLGISLLTSSFVLGLGFLFAGIVAVYVALKAFT